MRTRKRDREREREKQIEHACTYAHTRARTHVHVDVRSLCKLPLQFLHNNLTLSESVAKSHLTFTQLIHSSLSLFLCDCFPTLFICMLNGLCLIPRATLAHKLRASPAPPLALCRSDPIAFAIAFFFLCLLILLRQQRARERERARACESSLHTAALFSFLLLCLILINAFVSHCLQNLSIFDLLCRREMCIKCLSRGFVCVLHKSVTHSISNAHTHTHVYGIKHM